MSKFVKGTSILGVLTISFGVWQLSEMEENDKKEVSAIQNVDEQMRIYETVTIEKEEIIEVNNYKGSPFDTRTLRSIESSIEEDEQIKRLITKIGQGFPEGLNTTIAEEEWEVIEKESKKKQQLIEQLLDVTSHEELRQLARDASNDLAQMIEKQRVDLYMEAIDPFKYLADQL